MQNSPSSVGRRGAIFLRLLPAACALLLSGCGEDAAYGPAAVILPAHIRKIAVRPFANRTQFFGLEDKLRLRIEDELIRDGRFPYVNKESDADGVLEGEIANYIKEPVSYDANHVEEEVKLWVVINIRFHDRAAGQTLWEEPRLEHELNYFVETKPGGYTEEEAREILWDRFARDIVKRIVEGFGSVSGASEKKISGDPLPVPGSAPAPAPNPRPGERQAPPSPY